MDTQGGPRRPRSTPRRSAATKEILGLPPDEDFWVPDAVLDLYRRCMPRGEALRRRVAARFDASRVDRAAWDAGLGGRGLEGWEAKLPTFEAGAERGHPAGHQRLPERDRRTSSRDSSPAAADLTGNTGVPARDGRAASRPSTPAAASSTTASASTPWARP